MVALPQTNNLEQDPYASRFSTKPDVVDRIDPVVRSGNIQSDHALSQAQIASYEQNGFLHMESVFSRQEIDHLLNHVENLKYNEKIADSKYAIREPDSDEIRSFFHVHEYDPVFQALVSDQRLLDIVRQILGEVYVHQSRINLKPGFTGKEFYWHSDFETWHMEDGMPRMRALSCSIALTENNEFNGPLMLVPGSHKKYIICVGETPENNYKQSLRRQDTGVPDKGIIEAMVKSRGIQAPKGPPGSVVFFECNTLHGSNSNISPYPRSNAFIVYNSVDNKLVSPYCGLKPRPEHIAVRQNAAPLKPARVPFHQL